MDTLKPFSMVKKQRPHLQNNSLILRLLAYSAKNDDNEIETVTQHIEREQPIT